MINNTFLYDTYALLEILNKSPSYNLYTEAKIVINEFIFAEFCYKLFRENVKEAEEYISEVIPAIVHPTTEIIKKAMRFRLENKNKNLSMTDCVSYFMAKELGIKFLTGDKEFEKLENVEFVK